MFERILIAVDGSKHSKEAITRIIELAKESNSEVRVVNVHELQWGTRSAPLGTGEEIKEASDLVADVLAQFAGARVSASGEVRESLSGRIAGEIVAEAADWGATAIAIGTRGLTDLEGVFTGSVCHRVLHLTKLPVLVIP
jgi:nucleotide-binding universal stress UspA family protein